MDRRTVAVETSAPFMGCGLPNVHLKHGPRFVYVVFAYSYACTMG